MSWKQGIHQIMRYLDITTEDDQERSMEDYYQWKEELTGFLGGENLCSQESSHVLLFLLFITKSYSLFIPVFVISILPYFPFTCDL